ncbi:MAG: hypothetical protein JST84_26310 [Acidobacteria bacterium]|nr:hypothetical protein [Acidobacteriota bacterium]
MLTVILSVTFLFGSVFMQGTRKDIDPKMIPQSGATTKEFIPKGWKLQDEQAGDLNGDGLPDAVLQLIQDLPNPKDEFLERSRALLVLFKTSDGKYMRAAVAAKVLMCAGCGGMLGGTGDSPAADVKIEKGVLIVSQLSGAREATDLLQRFRYNPQTKQFLLIGQDINSYDRLVGNSEVVSTNFLTGKQITERRKLDKKGEKELLISKTSKTVPKLAKTIEQVDYEQ